MGKADLGLYGWKQLALWSIQHACLDDEEQEEVLGLWQIQWDSFLDWVVEQYGECLKASKDQR